MQVAKNIINAPIFTSNYIILKSQIKPLRMEDFIRTTMPEKVLR